jgi:SAM-dependent methyltransferase
MSDRQSFFQSVYQNNLWDSGESRSGQGSELAHTATLRDELPALLKQLEVRSMLDLPCGDFNWMQHMDLTGIQYVGADIVPEIVNENQDRFSNAQRRFICADVVEGPIPEVDLIFCRDCLIHFSFELAGSALKTMMASKARYLLLTHDDILTRYEPNGGKNMDLEALRNGVNYMYRPINFTLAPFSFPPPMHMIKESSLWDGYKTMALWRIDDLHQAIEQFEPGQANKPKVGLNP